MRLWNWFKGRGRKTNLNPAVLRAFSRVKRDIKALKTNLADTNVRVAKNARLIDCHSARLDKLEDIISTEPIAPLLQNSPTNRPSQPTSRLNEPTSRLVATKRPGVESLARLDVDSLTEQEKRIIGVFLDHRDMSLSYQDIAKSLDKSPSTVKNQMRQLKMKATLFDRVVDSQNKNRFRLKKQLKVEAELGGD